MANKNKQPGAHKRFTDVPTEKKIHEHLVNEEDLISEADIENVATDESVTKVNDTEIQLPVQVEIDESEKEEDDTSEKGEEKVVHNNSDPAIGTSWNILGS